MNSELRCSLKYSELCTSSTDKLTTYPVGLTFSWPLICLNNCKSFQTSIQSFLSHIVRFWHALSYWPIFQSCILIVSKSCLRQMNVYGTINTQLWFHEIWCLFATLSYLPTKEFLSPFLLKIVSGKPKPVWSFSLSVTIFPVTLPVSLSVSGAICGMAVKLVSSDVAVIQRVT